MTKKELLLFRRMLATMLLSLSWGSLSEPTYADESWALVYNSRDAVLKGESIFGVVSAEGILVPAQFALGSSSTLLVGVRGEPLKRATISRLDNEVDAALLKIGTPVSEEDLQNVHRAKMDKLRTFLPDATPETSAVPFATGGSPAPAENYAIKINGQDIGVEPVIVRPRGRQADVKMEVIRLSTAAVWNISVTVDSSPSLSFWIKGKRPTLNDVPSSQLKYDYQVLFVPLSMGRSINIPIEVVSIKEENYDWTVKVKSKQDQFQKDFKVRFTKNK